MLAEGLLEHESVGIALPLSASPDSTGFLTFGGGLSAFPSPVYCTYTNTYSP